MTIFSTIIALGLITAFALLAWALLTLASRHDDAMRATCARYDGITKGARR